MLLDYLDPETELIYVGNCWSELELEEQKIMPENLRELKGAINRSLEWYVFVDVDYALEVDLTELDVTVDVDQTKNHVFKVSKSEYHTEEEARARVGNVLETCFDVAYFSINEIKLKEKF